MGAITRNSACCLCRGILIGEMGENAGVEIIGSADAMSNRAVAGLWRACLRQIGASIGRIVRQSSSVSQSVKFLIRLAGVIPLGVTGNKAACCAQPATYGGLIAPYTSGRSHVLCRNRRHGIEEIARLVIEVIGFGHAGAGSGQS